MTRTDDLSKRGWRWRLWHRLRGCSWVTSVPQHVQWGGAGYASRECTECGRKQCCGLFGTPGEPWEWCDSEIPMEMQR